MADVKNSTARKGFLSLLPRVGGRNRKVKKKKEKPEKKKKLKAPSCLTKLCSCFLKKDHHQQESDQESAVVKDAGSEVLFDLICKIQSRRMDDQRSILPAKHTSCAVTVPTVNDKFQDQEVTYGAQADSVPDVPEIIIRTASEQDIQEGAESDSSFQTATTGSEDDGQFFDCLEIQEVSPKVSPTRESAVARKRCSDAVEGILDSDKHPSASPRSSRENRETSSVPKPFDPKAITFNDLAYVATLGRGGFGSVELVTLAKDQSRSFALKCIEKKETVELNWQKYVYSEKKILMEADCPFIIRLFCTFKDRKYVYMLLEACLGGDMYRHLRIRGRFDNNTARFYIACVVLGLEYLHERGIAHRDLKPANMFLDSRGFLKLGDLGLAWQSGTNGKMHSDRGTRYYKAPEVFSQKSYDLTVDYWSLGVTVYEFLSGKLPFTGVKPRIVLDICKGFGSIHFPRSITILARNFIKRLCRRDPNMRLGKNGMRDIKQHVWFYNIDWDALECQSLSPPIHPKLRGPTDTHNFYKQHRHRRAALPPDETSGWDADF